MSLKMLAIGLLGVVLGFGASRWFSMNSITVSDRNERAALAPSVLPEPDNHTDDLRSFRKLLLAQKGQPTLAAHRALFDRVRTARSSALLEEMRHELTLMPSYQGDPATTILGDIIDRHLDYHFPGNRKVFQGDAATSSVIDHRQEALKQWARQNPDAAFAMALKEPVVNHRPMMLQAVLKGAALTDPEAAYRLWSTLTEPDLRHRLSGSIAWHLAAAMPERHAEFAAAFPAEITYVRESAFRAWSSRAPHEALAALKELEAEAGNLEPAIRGILIGWGQQDPAAAAAWGDEYEATLPKEIMLQWARTDPAAALTYALDHPDDHRLETVTISWLQEDPESTLTWIDENLSDTEKVEVYRQAVGSGNIAQGLTESQRRMMVAWLATDPHPGVGDTVKNYFRDVEDVASTREWIESLSVIQERRLMPFIFGKWVEQSPDEAFRYLESLPTARAQGAILREALGPLWDPNVNETLKEWAQRHLSPEAWDYLNAN